MTSLVFSRASDPGASSTHHAPPLGPHRNSAEMLRAAHRHPIWAGGNSAMPFVADLHDPNTLKLMTRALKEAWKRVLVRPRREASSTS
jgi:hypothetical protein